MTVFYFSFAADREDVLAAEVKQSAGHTDQPDRKSLTLNVGGSSVSICGTTDAAIEQLARQLARMTGLNVIN